MNDEQLNIQQIAEVNNCLELNLGFTWESYCGTKHGKNDRIFQRNCLVKLVKKENKSSDHEAIIQEVFKD